MWERCIYIKENRQHRGKQTSDPVRLPLRKTDLYPTLAEPMPKFSAIGKNELHFTEEETEARRGEVSCPRSHDTAANKHRARFHVGQLISLYQLPSAGSTPTAVNDNIIPKTT